MISGCFAIQPNKCNSGQVPGCEKAKDTSEMATGVFYFNGCSAKGSAATSTEGQSVNQVFSFERLIATSQHAQAIVIVGNV